MKFSYNWLRELSGTKLAPEKLAEVLTLRSFEIKEMRPEGRDFMMDIDVLPNRASDCFSHIGLAKEIAAITNSKGKSQKTKTQLKGQKLRTKDFVSVDVKDKIACPRYTAQVVADVSIGESPEWIKEKLNVCGVQSINNVVDATNYVMLETGQPLHAFDLDKLDGKKIIVRRAERGEKMTTLDEKKIDLNEDILVIADSNEPLALAGIKGGKKAEIGKETKNIILESANFDRQNIYQTSKKIDLKTDASLRFGSGLDPNLTELAINRAASLIWEIAGGNAAKDLIDIYPKKAVPKKIKLDLSYVENLLGVKISAAKVKKILEGLGFSAKGSGVLSVIVSTSRMDVNLPEDLIEEVGRIYGYEQIPAVPPVFPISGAKRNQPVFWEDKIKDILCCAGFSEVYNYSFIGEKEAKAFGFKTDNLLALENPMSIEQSFLRPSLVPGLVKNTAKNLNYAKEVMIFEIGKVFELDLEQKMISGVMTGDKFYAAKGALEFLFKKIGVKDVTFDNYKTLPEAKNTAWWNSEKCAKLSAGRETIGFLGEVSDVILSEFKSESKKSGKIVFFDLFFDKIIELASENLEYRLISRYPEATRDIAVLVPKHTKAQEALDIIKQVCFVGFIPPTTVEGYSASKIKKAGSNIVREVELFDIYEGKELPEGKKNFAFRMIYQSTERTLSSNEIDEMQNKIIAALEEKQDYQVRK